MAKNKKTAVTDLVVAFLKEKGFEPSKRTTGLYKGVSNSGEDEYQVDVKGNNVKVFVRGKASGVWIKVESKLISTLDIDGFKSRMVKRLEYARK